MRVIHAVDQGKRAYHVRSLESGEEAIVISTPVKKPKGWFWSFSDGCLLECNDIDQRGRRDLYPRDPGPVRAR